MKNTVLNILFVLLAGTIAAFVFITVRDAADSRYSVAHLIDVSNAEAELSLYTDGREPDMLPVTAIYTVDPETASITGIQIEVLNCNYPSALTFINLPEDSRFTMSEGLYQRLCASLVEMPQVVTLSECLHYYGIAGVVGASSEADDALSESGARDAFSEAKNALEAATLMLSELAGTKISYYSMINKENDECLLTNMSSEEKSMYRESRESALPYAIFLNASGERTNSAFLIDRNSLTLKVYNAMYK